MKLNIKHMVTIANCLQQLALLLLICALCMEGSAAQAAPDALLTCPATWRETLEQKLRCDIAADRFNEQVCKYRFAGGTVLFKFQGRGSSASSAATVCTLQNVTANCPPQAAVGNGTCQCLEKENGKLVLELTILGNSSVMEGGSWSCVPQCIESQTDIAKNPLTYNATAGCKGVKFGEPASTTDKEPVTSTVTTGGSSPTQQMSSQRMLVVVLLVLYQLTARWFQQFWS